MSDDEAPVAASDPTPPTGSLRKVPLRNLFLDPNNYRFIDQPDYLPVPDAKVTDADIQRRTTNFLLGKNSEDVRDLLASFRRNGWLPVDQIQVRELSRGKYLVVEGNRRTAALKHLERRFEEGGIDLGHLDSSIFGGVPVVLYEDAGTAHHLVIMGLGHISGKRRWPAVNQARLLKALLSDHGWSEEDVCGAIGVSKRELRSQLRTLALCDLYRASDYGDQFTSDKYNLFREVVRSRGVSRWIGWNDTTQRPDNSANVDRLFSWLSKEEEESDTDDDPVTLARLEPVINTGADVRELSKIIDDANALKVLDETRRLSEATFSSAGLLNDRLTEGLARMHESIAILFSYASRLTDGQLSDVRSALSKLQGVMAAATSQPALVQERIERRPYNFHRHGHFTEVLVERFRRLQNLRLESLSRINIFLGPNNTGKTSILEAIHLLVGQNDIDELIRTVLRRGKLYSNPPASWLKEQLQDRICIEGRFDSIPDNVAKIVVRNDETEDLEDKTFYITSLDVEASYGSHRRTAVSHFFQKRDRITHVELVSVLCPAVFSSPFVQHDTDFLVTLFNKSVEAGVKDEVVQFVRERLDDAFNDVTPIVHGERQFTRFRVSHSGFEAAPDLTQFGEGVQRIIHIGLLFAYAQGGVVTIDEFENAIHYSLLKPFSRVVQELAVKFNVQVFLTSHSKECIDAFIENEYRTSDVSAYALRVENGTVRSYWYSGDRLEELLEAADVDLRGEVSKQ